MMQAVCLLWGVAAAIAMAVGFLPAWTLNWIAIPSSALGVVVSVRTLAANRDGRNSGAMAGIVLCVLATVIGSMRLLLGGWIL
jgi:hypothetical protein